MKKIASSLILVFLVLSCTIKASPIVPDKAAGVPLNTYTEQLSKALSAHVMTFMSPENDKEIMDAMTCSLELAVTLMTSAVATQALGKPGMDKYFDAQVLVMDKLMSLGANFRKGVDFDKSSLEDLCKKLELFTVKCASIKPTAGDAEIRKAFKDAVIGADEREAIYRGAVDLIDHYYAESASLPVLLLRAILHDNENKPDQCPACED